VNGTPLHDLARSGVLCVVSGPSGSGKTTLCHRAARELEGVVYSVSCTTRPPREGETDGADYHFLSTEDFERRLEAGEFLEHALVHGRHRYGTLKGEVLGALRGGKDVVMDLDVQGAAQLRASDDPEIRRALVRVFVRTSGRDDLRRRILGRGPMPEEELERRLRSAEDETRHWPEYDYTLVSADRDTDFARLAAIFTAERLRSSRWADQGRWEAS
jgi:guanylate kinase